MSGTTFEGNETTLCWRCSKSYPLKAEKCPHCGAANANVDMKKAAIEQMGIEQAENRGGTNYCEACGYVESHDPNCPAKKATHVDGKWCADLRCNKCYGAEKWIDSRIAKLERENANLSRALAKEVNDPTFMGEPVIDPRSKPIAWVVAVEEGGRMKVYGPQYNWRGHAEQDAELPRKRGQKAEVWACYPVADNGASTAHIESAPKDGTPFLAWVPSYYQGQGAWIVCLWMHGDWMDNRAWKVKPTLWLPLPEAPR